jgi:hypothetical protein
MADFFPPECFGPSRKATNGNGHLIEVELAGWQGQFKPTFPPTPRPENQRRFCESASGLEDSSNTIV